MVDRGAQRGAVSWLLGAALLGGGCAAPPPDVVAGSLAPAGLSASADGVVRVTWVFDARDLLRCRSSARELRHLQARFGTKVEVGAIALDADRSSVESFLRYERVTSTVQYLGSDDASAPAGIRWPALYLVRGRRVEAVYLGAPRDDAQSIRTRDVETMVASLLGRSDANGGADQNPSSRELR
jgi:hypothetical protein